MTRVLFVVLNAMGILFAQQVAGVEGTRPNIIIILADDMGYGDCGVYNLDSKIVTPNIDQLSREGVRFTDLHAPSNTCTPSRYGLLTGTNPLRMGVRNKTLEYGKPIIEGDESTIATLLKEQGYITKMIGKWHLGFQMNASGDFDFSQPLQGGPVDCGFDDYYGTHSSLGVAPHFYIRGREPVEIPTVTVDIINTDLDADGNDYEFITQELGAPGYDITRVSPNFCAEAVSNIYDYAQQDRPFFLYYASVAPHRPWVPTDEFRGKSGVGLYGDYIMQFDDVVGQINSALKATGLDQNTLLIFTSDNGAGPRAVTAMDLRNHDCSGGLRGDKASIYEGGHREAFIVKWPSVVPAGSVSDATLNLTDFFATFAELMDVDRTRAYPGSAQDSCSFLSVLLDMTTQFQRPAMINGLHGIREGDWKLLSGDRNADADILAQSDFGLYNLANDLWETTNVSAANPVLSTNLYEAYQTYWANRTMKFTADSGEGGEQSLVWTAAETLVDVTVRITADGAEDEAWNTSDTLMSATGSNPGYKGAFWSYDSNAAGEADIGLLSLQDGGLTPLDSLRVVTRSATLGDPSRIQAMFGMDTTALVDADTLSALSAQRVLGGTGADTADVRWFVEADSNLYVSAVIGTANATESNFSLDSTTALEWFNFDGNANISTAIGSSMGTDTLENMGWSNINAAGLYFDMENTVDANHTGELATFSVTVGLESGYTRWAEGYELVDTNMQADADLDGFDNLMEYALGGNPTNDDTSVVLPVSFVEEVGGTNWFYFVHNQRADDPEVTYRVWVKTNLLQALWYNYSGIKFIGQSDAIDGVVSVTNRVGVFGDAKFIKLEAEL